MNWQTVVFICAWSGATTGSINNIASKRIYQLSKRVCEKGNSINYKDSAGSH